MPNNNNKIVTLDVVKQLEYQVKWLTIENKQLLMANQSLEQVIFKDIRGPLNSVVFSVRKLRKLLAMSSNNKIPLEILDSLSNTIVLLNNYSKDIMLSNRIIKGHYQGKVILFPLDVFLNDIRQFFVDNLPENNKQILIASVSNLTLKTDKQVLDLLLRNSITNAIFYGSGNINISIKQLKGVVRILVTNEVSHVEKGLMQDLKRKLKSTSKFLESNDKFKLGIEMLSQITHQIGGKYSVQIRDKKFIVSIALPLNLP